MIRRHTKGSGQEEIHYEPALRVVSGECTAAAEMQQTQQVQQVLQHNMQKTTTCKKQQQTPGHGTHTPRTQGNYVTAKRRGIVDGVDFGYTGEVRACVRARVLGGKGGVTLHACVCVYMWGGSVHACA